MEEETLKQFTTALADAIREMDGTTELINPQDFAERILALPSVSALPQKNEIRIFYDNTKPASIWGGSWDETVFPYGTFLMAAGSGGTAGQTGGSNSVTLIEANLPPIKTIPNNPTDIRGEGDTNWLLPEASMNKYGDTGRGWNNIFGGEAYPSGKSIGASKPIDIRPQNVAVHIWRKVS